MNNQRKKFFLYIFYDVEATGLDTSSHHIISLGAVASYFQPPKTFCDVGQFIELDTFHEYVHTDQPITNSAIHGITTQLLFDNRARPFDQVIESFQEWILTFDPEGIVLVAHNGRSYDDKIFYANYLSLANQSLPYREWLKKCRVHGFLDSFRLLKESKDRFDKQHRIFHPDNPTKISFKLGICHYAWCGYFFENAHNALADAQALYRIFNSKPFLKYFSIRKIQAAMWKTDKMWSFLKQGSGKEVKMEQDRKRKLDPVAHEPNYYTSSITIITKNNFSCCAHCITFFSRELQEEHKCST
jgi:DNA polymerase III epsilon subunit-like protein